MGYNRGVPISVPRDLAESLAAAADDRTNIHNDICQQFDPAAPHVCTCGVPRLLADLKTLLLGERETVRAA